MAAAVSGGHLSARARVRSHDEIGRLGAAFDEVADSLTSLLEPIMIVILAFIVGTIVIALFLPLIKIIERMNTSQ